MAYSFRLHALPSIVHVIDAHGIISSAYLPVNFNSFACIANRYHVMIHGVFSAAAAAAVAALF